VFLASLWTLNVSGEWLKRWVLVGVADACIRCPPDCAGHSSVAGSDAQHVANAPNHAPSSAHAPPSGQGPAQGVGPDRLARNLGPQKQVVDGPADVRLVRTSSKSPFASPLEASDRRSAVCSTWPLRSVAAITPAWN